MLSIYVENNLDKIKHYCGIVGIYSKTPCNIPQHLFYTLFTLQHRGQESAGISYLKNGEIVTYRDLGSVPTVLSRYLSMDRPTCTGIGHVCYSTKGGNRIESAQPIHVACNKGQIALAHNGAITNAEQIRKSLVDMGAIIRSTTDTELIIHLLSRTMKPDFDEALKEVLENQVEGAYALVMMHEQDLYAMRDPNGIRPLWMGKKDDMVVFASETCALDILQITDVREVEPGEIVKVHNGEVSSFFIKPGKKNACIFELIYFARPDSRVFGKSVYMMRKAMGRALAEEENVEGDVVISVPDSGNYAALGYAERSGLPFEYGLSRNHYAGRSFIMPSQSQREFMVRMKLNPIKEVVAGKRIIMVDDSLVRGTTSKLIIKMLREAGAKEIHLRLSSPEVKWPCYFGIDITTREELISNRLTPEGLAEYTGADTVKFLSLESLKKCVTEGDDFCCACFSGEYPVKVEGV